MIPDLAGLLRLGESPALRQRRRSRSGGTFDIDKRTGREPLPRFQKRGRLRQQIRGEGRVEKHDVERLRRSAKETEGVRLLYMRATRMPLGKPRTQLAHGDDVPLD